MEETFSELFTKLEKGFDWEKVYNVMKFLDWHWGCSNNNYGIPCIDTMKRFVQELSRMAYETEKTHSSEGFTVGYTKYINELWISFTIEEVYSSKV